MMKPAILGLVRHILTTAGGVLVGSGYIDAETAQLASGALMTLVGVAWSIVEKSRD
jgi:hypothetical protein